MTQRHNDTVIKLENISKQYRLGIVGTKTLGGDLSHWWAKIRGKEDPTLKIGSTNILNSVDGEYVWALKDINLEVKQGEILGIIGKNGAGKSTLLKLLSRVTGPTTGQIKIKGRIASLLEVGTGFHPELTGKENIYLNGAIVGMTKFEINNRFDEIVDFAGIEKYIDTPVKRYSSGMYVRLAFAVAAHLEPDILVVDEVLAVGDAEFQKKAIGKMQDISLGEKRTVLFVSHNMGSIRGLCKNAVWLNNGSIIANEDAKSAVYKYLNSFNEYYNNKISPIHFDNQEITIESIVLKNDNGYPTNIFKYGRNIIIEIKYVAQKRIFKPYFWISISSQYGSMFSANMLFDDLRPDFIKGHGIITCVFKNVHLMPQMYTVSMGARDKNGKKFLVPTIESAAVFNVEGNASDLGMTGELADLFLDKASPLRVNYEWHFGDCKPVSPSCFNNQNK